MTEGNENEVVQLDNESENEKEEEEEEITDDFSLKDKK